MHTYEMVGVADQNSRTYTSDFGTYNKEDGFKLNEEVKEFLQGPAEEVINNVETLLYNMFHVDMWRLKKDEPKEMSIEDIEKELGYRIRIIDPNANTKKKITPEQREEMDSFIDIMNKWLLNR